MDGKKMTSNEAHNSSLVTDTFKTANNSGNNSKASIDNIPHKTSSIKTSSPRPFSGGVSP